MSATGAPSLRVLTDQLEEVGYAIVPGVLSDQESDALVQTLWNSSAEAERRGLPSYVPSLDPNPSNVRVFNLVDLDPVFGDLLAHPTATEIVASYLGEDYIISNFRRILLGREVARWPFIPIKHLSPPNLGHRPGR